MKSVEIETELYKKLKSGKSAMEWLDLIITKGWGNVVIKIQNHEIVCVEIKQTDVK